MKKFILLLIVLLLAHATQYKAMKTPITSKFKFYKTKHHIVATKHSLLVQCNPNETCTQTFKHVDVLNYRKISNAIYLLNIDRNVDLFELSNYFSSLSCVKIAQPNFYHPRELR